MSEFLIETVSGKRVDIINPNPDDILLDDLAWGLSRINRFAGATITEVPYNNGQHSLFVAHLARESGCSDIEYSFCLFHDSSEYLTGDFPSPLKRVPEIRTAIKKIENNLLSIIFDKFCGRQPSEEEEKFVKSMDIKAQQIEAFQFMYSRGSNWDFPTDAIKPTLMELQSFPPPETAIESYKKFILVTMLNGYDK